VHAGVGVRASARFAGAGQLASHLRQVLDGAAFAPRLAALSDDVINAGGTPRAADIVEAAAKVRSGARATA
jgi:UDP:flavonoid glycosyltransferase YjiC (YdhE family)